MNLLNTVPEKKQKKNYREGELTDLSQSSMR